MDGFMREFSQSRGICKFYVVLLYLLRYLLGVLLISELYRWSTIPSSAVRDTFEVLMVDYLIFGMFVFGVDRLLVLLIRSNNLEGIN